MRHTAACRPVPDATVLSIASYSAAPRPRASHDEFVTRRARSRADSRQSEALASSDGARPPPKPGPVDIVLVHGIGRQREGANLVTFSNQLVRVLRAEFGRDAVVQTDTHLRGAAPARTTLTIGDVEEAGACSVTIREAHWADAFHPPKTRAVLLWALKLAPLAVVARSVHIVRNAVWRWWDHPLEWWRIVFAAVLAVVVWPLSVLVIAAVLVSSLVRPLIPIRFLKEALATFELGVSEVLGDAYLFIISEADRSAIQTVVGDELRRVDKRPVIVIAHSQGAQVAVDAIAEHSAEVDELVTVGAAIGQIEWFRRLYQVPGLRWAAAAAPLLFYGGLCVAAWSITQLGQDEYGTTWTFSGARAFIGGLAFAAVASTLVHSVLPVRIFREEDKRRLSSVRRWTNIEATADPVSAGSLVDLAYEGATERIITNRSNFLTDHTAYFDNAEVMRVIKWRLLHVVTGDEPDSRVREHDDRCRRARYESSRHLAVMRLALVTLAIATGVRLAPTWTERANAWWAQVTPSPLAGPMDWLGSLDYQGIQVRQVFLGACIVALAGVLYLPILAFIAVWRANDLGPQDGRWVPSIAWVLDAALIVSCVALAAGQLESPTSLVDGAGVAFSLTMQVLVVALLFEGLARIPSPVRRRVVRTLGPRTGWLPAVLTLFLGAFTHALLKPHAADELIKYRFSNLVVWLGLGAMLIASAGLTNFLNSRRVLEGQEWTGFAIADKPAPGPAGRRLGIVLVAASATVYAWYGLDQNAVGRRLLLLAATLVAAVVVLVEDDNRLRARLAFGGSLSVLFVIQLVDWTMRHD